MSEEVNSIVEYVAMHAKNMPDKFSIIDESGMYTYESIWKKVKYVAHFISQNVVRGQRVMAECTQSAMFLVLDLACELSGAIFVPFDRAITKEHFKDIYQETKPILIVSETSYELNNENVICCNYKDVLDSLTIEIEDYLFPDCKESAEILYTTGTTGRSKGIEITNANNMALAENIKYGTEMESDNVELIPLPISHSHGLRCCYTNFYNGSTIVLIDGIVNVRQFFQYIELYHVTAIDISPSAATLILRFSKGKLSEYSNQLKYIQIGTAVLQEDLKQELCKALKEVRLYNFYGSTESGRTCVIDFNHDKRPIGCIGKPTVNSAFAILDKDRNLIDSSEKNMGILATAGSMNMKGYWNHPELTDKVMKGEYICSNDIGYMDDEGYVYTFGRIDDVINYKGIKIIPEQVEEQVMKYDGVMDCACIGVPDSVSGEIPKIFIVMKKEENFSKKDLMVFLKEYLENDKLPREIELIEKIPRTHNGKIQRELLRNMNKNIL